MRVFLVATYAFKSQQRMGKKENPMSQQSSFVSRLRVEVARNFMSRQDFSLSRQRDV